MNKYKNRAARVRITKALLAKEIRMLKDGYNPITKSILLSTKKYKDLQSANNENLWGIKSNL